MLDNFNVNLRKSEGFLTSIPCIPISEYGQSNAPRLVEYSVSKSGTGGLESNLWPRALEKEIIADDTNKLKD